MSEKMNERAYLFLNGQPPSVNALEQIAEDLKQGGIFSVCADGAFSYIKDYFLPDLMVADFDSFSRCDMPSCVNILELPTQKDYTDGHIAMQHIIEKGIKEVTIFGAAGKRIDHMISNFSLLSLACNNNVSAVMDTGDFLIEMAGGSFRKRTSAGKTVSLVPYSDTVHILYTRGLKYPICDRKLDKVHILGISNEAISSEIEYAIKSGLALVFIEK